ncbi:unnamed protein product [Musa acuminata subsp. burmannicoides]
MQQQAQVPQFGNWETAQDVPHTQCFNHARRRKSGRNATNLIDPNESSEAHAKAISSLDRAAPSTTESIADTTKPKDANPLKTNGGNFRRTATPPVRKSPANRAIFGDNQKRFQGRIASEVTPGRIRRNLCDRTNATPDHHYVFVPPFAGWDENDPESGQKYTEVFNKVADQRTPGTPFKPSQPSSLKQKSTEPKGCGCLSWIF